MKSAAKNQILPIKKQKLDKSTSDASASKELEHIQYQYLRVRDENYAKAENITFKSAAAAAVTIVGVGFLCSTLGLISPLIPLLSVLALPFIFSIATGVSLIPSILIVEMADKKKKPLKNAYGIELGIYLYEKHGITLLSTPAPIGRTRKGSTKELIYFGKMKKDGHVFKGSIYRNEKAITVETSQRKAITP